MKWVFTFVILAVMMAIGFVFFIAFHCKWKWTDLKFEHVKQESVASVEIQQCIPNAKNNLVQEEILITSTTAIRRIVKVMQYNEVSSVNHPISHWYADLQFSFKDQSSLSLTILKTENQGCLATFCSDCIGVKETVRNDSLCMLLEELVAMVEK